MKLISPTLRTLAALLFFIVTAHAGEPALRVYWRRHHASEPRQDDSNPRRGFIILTPTDPKAKLDRVAGELEASILLPKDTTRPAKTLRPPAMLRKQSGVIATDHYYIELTEADDEAIEHYLKNSRSPNGDQLPPGKRFEPVLELRGFKINEEPMAVSVLVPTSLELELDAKQTDLLEDTAVFRGIYIPPVVREDIGKSANWTTKPKTDEPPAKGDDTNACRVEFDEVTDTVTLHVLNRLNLADALREQARKEEPFQFVFEVPKAKEDRQEDVLKRADLRRVLRLYSVPTPTESKTKKKDVKGASIPKEEIRSQGRFQRPKQLQYPRRNYRFGALAPASNTELPLYVSGSFSNSHDAAGKQKNAASFEVNLNFSDQLVPLDGKLSWGRRYSLAPAFNAKMNTTGIVNDENSAVWLLPIAVDFFPGACCKGEKYDRFSMPVLRRVSFYTGYRGEYARVSGKQSNGAMFEIRTFFSRVKSRDVSFKFQPIAGFEIGKYREKTANEFFKGDKDGPSKQPDGKPVSEKFLVERNDTYSRLHGGVHSTLTLGPSSSLNVNYDMRRLLRKESYFDKAASSSGYFTPYSRDGFPSTFPSLDSEFAFVAAGVQKKGTRRYLEITFNQTISKFFDIKASFTRGEIAPAFQFVHKLEVGIAIRILGKDSFSSR